MPTAIGASASIRWWKEPTKDQWIAWWAAWMGWTLDAFDFTIFLLIMLPISQEFGVPLVAVTAVFTITLWLGLINVVVALLLSPETKGHVFTSDLVVTRRVGCRTQVAALSACVNRSARSLLPFVGFGRGRGGANQAHSASRKLFVRAANDLAVEACRHVVGNVVSDEPPQEFSTGLVAHHADPSLQRLDFDPNTVTIRWVLSLIWIKSILSALPPYVERRSITHRGPSAATKLDVASCAGATAAEMPTRPETWLWLHLRDRNACPDFSGEIRIGAVRLAPDVRQLAQRRE
jgi:hypothetical protein